MTSDLRVIAWDFDGVLNRNVIDGRFTWADNFERDTGASLKSFADYLFKAGFRRRWLARPDLKTMIGEWIELDGYHGTAETIMSYWFDIDARPDARMLALLERTSKLASPMSWRQIMKRTARIISNMIWVLARRWIRYSPPAYVRGQPDDGYFQHILDDLSVIRTR